MAVLTAASWSEGQSILEDAEFDVSASDEEFLRELYAALGSQAAPATLDVFVAPIEESDYFALGILAPAGFDQLRLPDGTIQTGNPVTVCLRPGDHGLQLGLPCPLNPVPG